MWGLSVHIHRGGCPISTRGDVISTPFFIRNKNKSAPPRDRKQSKVSKLRSYIQHPATHAYRSPSPTPSNNSDSQDLVHGDKPILCFAVTSISLGALFRDTARTSSSSVAGDFGVGLRRPVERNKRTLRLFSESIWDL